MYRHNTNSIRESEDKVFISKAEKEKFNNYPSKFITRDDSYNYTGQPPSADGSIPHSTQPYSHRRSGTPPRRKLPALHLSGRWTP